MSYCGCGGDQKKATANKQKTKKQRNHQHLIIWSDELQNEEVAASLLFFLLGFVFIIIFKKSGGPFRGRSPFCVGVKRGIYPPPHSSL
jgi:hypothetical protein